MNIRGAIFEHDSAYLNNLPEFDSRKIVNPNYYVIKEIEQSESGKITIVTANGKKFIIKPVTSDGKSYELEIGDTLFFDDDGRLQVKVTNEIEEDNTLPVTSAAVAVEIGNIDVLLGAI